MGLTIPQVLDQPTGSKFELVPADNHVAITIGVTDLGTHTETYQGQAPKKVKKIRIQWELPHVKREDGSTATISKKFTFSFHEKSNFRKLLDKWLGLNWHTQVKGGTLEFLLGQPAMVQVDHSPNKNDPTRMYADVVNVAKVPKGMPIPEATKDTFYLDLDAKHLPEKLSVYDAEFIRQSDEFKAGGFTDLAPKKDENGNGNGFHAKSLPPAVASVPHAAEAPNGDVPF